MLSKAGANTGQALIELILAIAIGTIILTSLISAFIGVNEGFVSNEKRDEANEILQQDIEALRSAKEIFWELLGSGNTYHIEQSGAGWSVVPGPTTQNGFTKEFSVKDICRLDSISLPIDCSDPQSVVDPSTKFIEASVSWSFFGDKSVETQFLLSRYFDNQTWIQTTKTEFDQGTFDNTQSHPRQGGEVQLISSSGDSSFVAEYDNENDYDFDTAKIEISGSNAQLKGQGTSFSGSTTNSGFNTNASGWVFNSWGQNIGQTGSYQANGGNPSGYVDINMPRNRQVQAGGYWRQAFTTNGNNPTATLTFDWRVFTFDFHPDVNYRLYAFVDTSPSAPVVSQNVWDSGPITGITTWSAPVNINVSSKVPVAGTYYLKVAVFVNYPGPNRGPFTAGFDNVSLSWSGTTGSYPTDQPTIERVASFTSPSINSWISFAETAQTGGGSIGYQLSDNDGTTWRYFNGSTWIITSSPTQYNDVATVNTNISSFPTTNNKINVRAFLISDGTQLVKLDRVEITYSGANTGTFTSSTFDTTTNVGFNRIVWTEFEPSGTNVQFQIAVNNDNFTWNFYGPDGTPGSYFEEGSGVIHLNSVSGQYIRYKIFFSSTSGNTPTVEDVTLNYSP